MNSGRLRCNHGYRLFTGTGGILRSGQFARRNAWDGSLLLASLGLLCMLGCGSEAFAAPADRDNRSYHFVERLAENIYVNWSTGYMYARVTVPVRKAEAASLTEARLAAIRDAREKARASLSQGILLLPVDAGGTYGDRMRSDARLRQDFETIERDFHLLENTTGEGTVSLRLGLPLFGRTGLLRRLPVSEDDGGASFADVKLPVPPERFTGLILFTELAPSFRPSLRPSLSLPGGDRFLTIENRNESRGLFFPDEAAARSYGRVGDRPLILFAPAVLNQTDLVIDTSDAKKILGNARLFKAVREGRVAFVVLRSQNGSAQKP